MILNIPSRLVPGHIPLARSSCEQKLVLVVSAKTPTGDMGSAKPSAEAV